MNERQQPVMDYLGAQGIAFDRYEHPPVATVAEAEIHWAGIDATHCKNLFLRNQKGDRHYLVIVPHAKTVDLRQVADQIGDGKLSFASPERLLRHLGLTPGSVSPFGLINDAERRVRVFLDAQLREAGRVGFHPNDNTATLVLAFSDFERFLRQVGHDVRFIRT
ncbi:MAG: prolyl-tRNA synthetase associated domain-containing protein [Vicinamibacteria bacterium]|nr:prolyl-tRNA synthetase associated domain-containing protein [Vicinamibacteria bacterium]